MPCGIPAECSLFQEAFLINSVFKIDGFFFDTSPALYTMYRGHISLYYISCLFIQSLSMNSFSCRFRCFPKAVAKVRLFAKPASDGANFFFRKIAGYYVKRCITTMLQNIFFLPFLEGIFHLYIIIYGDAYDRNLHYPERQLTFSFSQG